MSALRPTAIAGSLVVLAAAIACDGSPVDPAPAVFRTAEAPSGTSAVAVSEGRIDISWQDNSADETGFEVHRSTAGATFALLATTAAGVTSYSDAGLDPSTEHCYQVRALRTTGRRTHYSVFSTSACATTTTPGPPSAPSNTHVVVVSDTRIDVYWQDNSTNETAFEIHRSASGPDGAFTLVATTAADITARGDPGLNPSTEYCYTVRAVRAMDGQTDYSEFSNTACATTLAPGSGPGLHVTAVTTGGDLDADGYWVDVWKDYGWSRLYVGGASLPTNGTVTFSGLDPADYQVEFSGVALNCDLTSPNPQTTGSLGTVEFDVTCTTPTQVAFASSADGNAEIYVINANGTGRTRLTMHPASDVEPAWSSDGSKIAFRSDRDGNAEIYVMNADGSNPVRLTDAPGADYAPSWSPDGTRIAFTSDRDGNGEVYVMNADGTGPVNVTNNAAYDADPAWSPDGASIAFTSNRDGIEGIYLMSADGSAVTRLSSDPWVTDAQPAWSPDGAKLAFSRSWCSEAGCKSDILIMMANGSNVAWATVADAFAGEAHTDPVWSPDGRKIAFVSTFTGVDVIRVDGTGGAALGSGVVHVTDGFNPSWRR